MSGPAGLDPARKLRLRNLISLVAGVLIVGVGLVFVGRSMVRQWDDVSDVLAEADPLLVCAAVLVAVGAMAAVGWRWREAMGILGASPRRSDAMCWFGMGQIGKYVPGGFWHVIGQAELARRGGVEGGIAYASMALSTLSLYGSAALVVVVMALTPGAVSAPWWVMLGAAVLWSVSVEPRAVGVALRRMGIVGAPARRRLLGYAIGNLWVWFAVGGATVATAHALGAEGSWLVIAEAAVASWLIGFLALPAPGGLGVREAAFVLLVADQMTQGLAAAVAVSARLVFLVGDGLLFVLALVVASRADAVSAGGRGSSSTGVA